jgi:hypothetical protein
LGESVRERYASLSFISVRGGFLQLRLGNRKADLPVSPFLRKSGVVACLLKIALAAAFVLAALVLKTGNEIYRWS